jgi:hypothetical protein
MKFYTSCNEILYLLLHFWLWTQNLQRSKQRNWPWENGNQKSDVDGELYKDIKQFELLHRVV